MPEQGFGLRAVAPPASDSELDMAVGRKFAHGSPEERDRIRKVVTGTCIRGIAEAISDATGERPATDNPDELTAHFKALGGKLIPFAGPSYLDAKGNHA